MNKTKRKALLKAFRDLHAKVEAGTQHRLGICFNICERLVPWPDMSYSELHWLFKTWPRRTGTDLYYPITKLTPSLRHQDNWRWEGEQLELRRDLIRHCIEQLEAANGAA